MKADNFNILKIQNLNKELNLNIMCFYTVPNTTLPESQINIFISMAIYLTSIRIFVYLSMQCYLRSSNLYFSFYVLANIYTIPIILYFLVKWLY